MLGDIVMPGTTNGFSLAVALRERQPSLPVVLMTGFASELQRALEEGFEVMPKPCGPELIAEALARALSSRDARRSRAQPGRA